MTEELRLVRLKARGLDAALASPEAARDAFPKQRLDVYANWVDVLKALEGTAEPGPAALSKALHGSQKPGAVGFSSPDEVKAIASHLASASLDDLRRRATSGPAGSDDEVGQRRANWVLEWYGHIREFYERAAKKGQAVVCVFR